MPERLVEGLREAMTIKETILEHTDEIVEDWYIFARTHIEMAEDLDRAEVKDHILDLLDRVVSDLEEPQSAAEQIEKAKGDKDLDPGEERAAMRHGAQRLEQGFSIFDISAEFRALRASVIRIWIRENAGLEKDLDELVRFNEAIDEAWILSVDRFQMTSDKMRDYFLGVLGHDLRSPLSAITVGSRVLSEYFEKGSPHDRLCQQMLASGEQMKELITNLLELTRLRLGNGLTIERRAVDLVALCERVTKEIRTSYPSACMVVKNPTTMECMVDPVRISQVMTNLTQNAIRHGNAADPITLSLWSQEDSVFIGVHNHGPVIDPEVRRGMFRDTLGGAVGNDGTIRLGLHIVYEIVRAHDGSVEVVSDALKGTTFTVHLPECIQPQV
ncbi:ATP-binding protein [Haloferula chungangensis]|uniref:histidine kinase n=2 Tax=Haloferula chungangensis TaxID=1048331 RepID=A0ABW2L9C0_9BACT